MQRVHKYVSIQWEMGKTDAFTIRQMTNTKTTQTD